MIMAVEALGYFRSIVDAVIGKGLLGQPIILVPIRQRSLRRKRFKLICKGMIARGARSGEL